MLNRFLKFTGGIREKAAQLLAGDREQVQGQSCPDGKNHSQPETERLRAEQVHPEVASYAARTGICPLSAADDSDKPQQQYCRHGQIAVAGFLPYQIRKILYFIQPFHISPVYFFRSAANSLSCGSPSKKSTSICKIIKILQIIAGNPHFSVEIRTIKSFLNGVRVLHDI